MAIFSHFNWVVIPAEAGIQVFSTILFSQFNFFFISIPMAIGMEPKYFIFHATF